MKKIQLQCACSESRPPVIGPSASATAETPTQMPIAIPRWRGGKVAVMIESVAGFISAAPTPCTARHAISISPLVARPQASEQVGQLAAGQHQHRKGEEVAVDDPLERGDADVEVALDRRQRDVHDRVVEHDHEQPEGDGDERPPLAMLVVEEAGENPCSHTLVRTKLAG